MVTNTEICQNNNIFIVNGRIGEDKLTCKNSSTVDYVICSVLMFKLFENFYIHNFCNLYSDVHCPITFELKSHYHIETRPTVQPRDDNNTRQYKWDPEQTKH